MQFFVFKEMFSWVCRDYIFMCKNIEVINAIFIGGKQYYIQYVKNEPVFGVQTNFGINNKYISLTMSSQMTKNLII